ncbi:NIPSNAP family protein [Bacillus sp. FJAT-49711]|uniref:NIPSNAP family protein n=1 Tax=Bacillus sp. FJAT-49711 TaxID=2833585 RepID=UPI001BCA5078|nr:NIPSNAP family protein [Bacillus sp. FJAT-49711]MBS4219939.1 NIPSNAP family protein [Bacillus sp. FJAT-49711]
MFYRRKFYIVKNEFVDTFNKHFIETNLPNQIKCGARLIGRWMVPSGNDTTEIFAVWEYDSYEKYEKIEKKVRSNSEHVNRINQWYEKHGGRESVFTEYILEVRNEEITSTLMT